MKILHYYLAKLGLFEYSLLVIIYCRKLINLTH